MVLEVLPIGTLLAVLVTQILETAVAAQDVLIEKETFRVLSKYLQDIQPLLTDLRKQDMKDTRAARTALEGLQDDLNRASKLVDQCTNKPRFYLLVHCRGIVYEAQQITRDIGKSLQVITLASSEVSVEIRDNVNRLREQMLCTEFKASESKLQVINKLEAGLREERTDEGFANDLIIDIARAVGVPVEGPEIRKEIASLRREKAEAAERKERDEEAFMEQIIRLLSRADSAYEPESSKQVYHSVVGSIMNSDFDVTEVMSPLKSFICPLKQAVMIDPVSLVTGSCFERTSIHEWFDNGNTTDPLTLEEISDQSLKPNVLLRQAIEEWQERNYCIRILQAKSMLESREDSAQVAALENLNLLCQESKVNQDWIAAEDGLVDRMVEVLKAHNKDVKRAGLIALLSLVTGNSGIKERVTELGVVEHVVRFCLGRVINVAKPAAALLLELLDGNEHIGSKIGQERSSILLLVLLLKSDDEEAVQLAKLVLDKLSSDDENVVQMVSVNWCTPLVTRLCQGTDDMSRLAMAKALGKFELTDANKMMLAEQGAIPPLVKMMISGKVEAKAAAVGALKTLSNHCLIKAKMVSAGAIPVVLELLFSGKYPLALREEAAAILDNLAANDGMKYFVDSNDLPVEEGQIVENLLAVQESSSKFPVLRKYIVHTLFGLVALPDASESREKLMMINGIPTLFPLLKDPDSEMRALVIQILYYLSELGGADIAKLLQENDQFGSLVKFFNEDVPEDVQIAAAGIIAGLPQGDLKLTAALVQADAIPALVTLLQAGNPKVKEAAVGALLRFTDPTDIETQRSVANLGVHSLLVRMMQSGSELSKASSAMALRNFSSSTPKLSEEPEMVCLCFRPSHFPPNCKVHSGTCDVKKTFCIIEAEAVPGLISLLHEPKSLYVEAAVEALATLVINDEILHAGVEFLLNAGAVDPIISLLNQGSPETKEKAVMLVERLFKVRKVKEVYGPKVKISLVDMASFGKHNLKKRAAIVLTQLQLYPEASSTY